MRPLVSLALASLLLATMSCSGSVARPSFTATHPGQSPVPVESDIPFPSPTQTPSPASVETIPITQRDLDQQAPWLLVVADDAAYLFNPDATGQTAIIEPAPSCRSLSPTRNTLAYITDTDPQVEDAGLQLRLFHLPEGPDVLLTDLQNPSLQAPGGSAPGSDAFEAMRAILGAAPEWSHDGEFIAFIGQQEGPSADLYVYDLAGDTSTRLTDGPSQAIIGSWSPDDTFIFHAGVWGFGSGAGYSNAGSWVASRDGSVLFETTTGNGTDEVLAWQNSDRFLFASWSQPCGMGFIKSYSIQTRDSTDVWPYYFEDFAFNPSTGSLLLAIPSDHDFCMEGQPTGLYAIESIGATPSLISYKSFRSIISDDSLPGAYILTGDDGLHRLLPSGEIEPLGDPPSHRGSYSAEARLWLWYGRFDDSTGLWVGTVPGDAVRVYDLPVSNATWSPDGSAILFLGRDDGILYRANAPVFQPQPAGSVGSLILRDNMWWVDR